MLWFLQINGDDGTNISVVGVPANKTAPIHPHQYGPFDEKPEIDGKYFDFTTKTLIDKPKSEYRKFQELYPLDILIEKLQSEGDIEELKSASRAVYAEIAAEKEAELRTQIESKEPIDKKAAT